MKIAPKKVVLFADMLGFAELTEQFSLDPEAFRDAMTATADELYDLVYRYGELNPLAIGFLTFHSTVERCLSEANRGESHQSIIFSDSLFVAGETREALGLAEPDREWAAINAAHLAGTGAP